MPNKKDEYLTPRELFTGNEWVIDNPILRQVVEDAPTATQANRYICKTLSGLKAVNKIASAVRKLTILRIKFPQTWKEMSKLPRGYQSVNMFRFEKSPTYVVDSKEFYFSKSIDFYPANSKSVGGIAGHKHWPLILKEVHDGWNSGMSRLNGETNAEIKTIFSEEKLLQPTKLHSCNGSSYNLGKFIIRFDKISPSPIKPNLYAVKYSYDRDMPIVVSQVVSLSPQKGENFSKIYRKVSLTQDFDLHSGGYEDSIVVLLDLGIVPKSNDEAIGEIVFQRKTLVSKSQQSLLNLNFHYVIMPSLVIIPWHEYIIHYKPHQEFDGLKGIISFDYDHLTVVAKSSLNVSSKIFGELQSQLFSTYKKVNPYGENKSLKLNEMFGDFLENPPEEIITLFK